MTSRLGQILKDLEGTRGTSDLGVNDLLGLPAALRQFLAWIVMERAATCEQAAGMLGDTEEAARSLLEQLATLGLIERLPVCGVPRYRVCLTPRSLRVPPELLDIAHI